MENEFFFLPSTVGIQISLLKWVFYIQIFRGKKIVEVIWNGENGDVTQRTKVWETLCPTYKRREALERSLWSQGWRTTVLTEALQLQHRHDHRRAARPQFLLPSQLCSRAADGVEGWAVHPIPTPPWDSPESRDPETEVWDTRPSKLSGHPEIIMLLM